MSIRGRRMRNGASGATEITIAASINGNTNRIVATSIAITPTHSPITSQGRQTLAERVFAAHHTQAQYAQTSHIVGIRIVENALAGRKNAHPKPAATPTAIGRQRLTFSPA